jgi:hypothetical protein
MVAILAARRALIMFLTARRNDPRRNHTQRHSNSSIWFTTGYLSRSYPACGWLSNGHSGDPETQARFASMPIASALHVLAGGTVLLIGGFQFSLRLRVRQVALHRSLGRVYLILAR